MNGVQHQKRGEMTVLWTGKTDVRRDTTNKIDLTLLQTNFHSRTHAFKIKDPKSKPTKAKIREYLRQWTQHDAQFDLGDGIFTVQPTSVFLAINAGRHTYCKLIIKKDASPDACARVSPSPKLLQFMDAHPDVMDLLDKDTISVGLDKSIAEIKLPLVWAEPIPGPM